MPCFILRRNLWHGSAPPFLSKKCLSEDNRKDELILDRPPAMEGARGKGITAPRSRCGQQKKAKAFRVLPFRKASEAIFYSSVGSGLRSETNTRVPKEEELITINIDTSEQSRARLQLQTTPGCASSASRDL